MVVVVVVVVAVAVAVAVRREGEGNKRRDSKRLKSLIWARKNPAMRGDNAPAGERERNENLGMNGTWHTGLLIVLRHA